PSSRLKPNGSAVYKRAAGCRRGEPGAHLPNKRNQLSTLRRRQQRPQSRFQVVALSIGLTRRRNDGGHGLLAQRKLEKHLCPGRDAHLSRPAGERFALDAPEQRAVVEVAIREHRDSELLCEREHSLLRAALCYGVVDL